jgi:hypothetical protein
METSGSISSEEASAALASVAKSRARVLWGGYPAWYWLVTGACIGAMSYSTVLPDWWVLAASVVIAAVLVVVARAASRARGVCEGWTRRAMTRRDAVMLYGPVAFLIIVNAVVTKFVWWWPILGAVLVCGLFAGIGLTRSARAARW